MAKFSIGVMTDSFKLPFEQGLAKAAEVGAQGIQLYVVDGEMKYDTFDDAKVARVRALLEQYGLVISAVCGDFGGHGFERADENAWKIPASKAVADLAVRLGTKVVTTHIGVVPEDKNHERYKILQEACHELAMYADSVGAKFAIETGPERSIVLKEFLDSLGSTGVSVNLDPANLVMVTGDDPVQAVYNLQKYIVHTHAKDGVKLLDVGPEIVYRVVHPVPEEFQGKKFYQEVPLGQGSVDFPAYLAALKDIGYKGFLTIERECGEDPAADIGIAVEHLKKSMAGL